MATMDEKRRNYLTRAVSPTLFSAALHPDLIIALMIANLLSPRLWELAGRIGAHGASGTEETMRKLHKFVNRNFYHPDSITFSHIWGLHERERITDPDELDSSDRAMAIILKGLEFTHDADDAFLRELLRHGAAPRYVYPTVDVILAYAPMLRDMKTHPAGLTSCLDECVLIASLALALGCCSIEDIVFVGSPLHYTLYLFHGGEGYMFNAKREFFRERDWSELSGGSAEQSARLFIRKLYVCDRIISPFGHCVFPGGPTTIAADRLEAVVGQVARFLSVCPPELVQALETVRGSKACQPSGVEHIADASPLDHASVTETVVGRAGDDAPLLEAALYAFRHPKVKAPELYRDAALKGFRSYILSGGVQSADDAWEIADSIAGRESIYGETSRIAMPEEVLAFQTANDEERELLADSLMKHSGLVP